MSFYCGPESGLPAFTAGLAVIATPVHPHWGPDYAPTGVITGGQFATAFPDGFTFATVGTNMGWEVFPPNVCAGASGIAATAQSFAIDWREYLSAEELDRWHTARPL
jgi:hypothetical protein